MTEPIIIDVTKCKFYKNSEHIYNLCGYLKCENNPDCYFKQLKRLEKENEELKKELDFKEKQSNDFMIKSGEMVEKLNNLMTKYRQALEEIKKSMIAYRIQADPPIVVCDFLDEIIYKIIEVLND